MLNNNIIVNREVKGNKLSIVNRIRAMVKQLEQVKYNAEDMKNITAMQMYNQINK